MEGINTITVYGRERVAVNKLARIVTSPAKESDIYYPKRINERTYDAPLKTKAVPHYLKDITGAKRGRMTIVGYVGYRLGVSVNTRKKHPPHTWLAKCVCGKYETRDNYKWNRGTREGRNDFGCYYCRTSKALSLYGN